MKITGVNFKPNQIWIIVLWKLHRNNGKSSGLNFKLGNMSEKLLFIIKTWELMEKQLQFKLNWNSISMFNKI